MRTLILVLACSIAAPAEKVTSDQLIRMAQLHAPGLEQAIRDTFADPKDDKIAKGTAYAGEHGVFLFPIASEKQPFLQINQNRPEPATRAGGLWVWLGPLKQG